MQCAVYLCEQTNGSVFRIAFTENPAFGRWKIKYGLEGRIDVKGGR